MVFQSVFYLMYISAVFLSSVWWKFASLIFNYLSEWSIRDVSYVGKASWAKLTIPDMQL